MEPRNGELKDSNKRARPVEDEGIRDDGMATAAEGFFEALSEAGVTHCFVNLEFIQVPDHNYLPLRASRLVSSPGQCVIVHVDCGTLAMGQSIHNASVGRVPVLCFAGLSPFTQNGELLGSRTEYETRKITVCGSANIDYCRYSGEVKTGRNIKEMVSRALHFAMSDSKGPVYLTAAREVLEEHVSRRFLGEETLSPIVPSALPESEVELISTTLINAKRPLVITGYLGRNPQAPALLAELCDKLPISVLESVGSDLCIRTDHEAYLGVTVSTHPAVCEADVILILDCDVPWIPNAGKPQKGTTIFHLDVDPLKQQMPLFSINATRRLKVSCEAALRQLNAFIDKQTIEKTNYAVAFEARANRYLRWREALQGLESPSQDGVIRVPYLASRLRQHLPDDTVYLVEAVSNAGLIIQHLHLTLPGTLVGSGAGGLGWGGGAALGVKLAKPDAFICAIVGDGTFLFSQMESVYWIARRYDLPFLLVVLNNGGWNAPKVSALLVHQDGLASKSNRRVKEQDGLDSAIQEAANVVRGGNCAVIEVS
ncbi:hypothetical protein BDV26DRAFT_304392 [Aspergillus bertholletiae]|uniref:Uncharacterized protein n=1 Tax=Aspergillus bertholletiae TaxID=1226010 RepID=A0A5N7B947_9EURO|nr:hypothetical protein BDV26DRAFT_304392 [Aspergillus bertholletiae]